MATMNVLDSVGSTVAIEKPLAPGQATMANSRPVVLSSNHTPVPGGAQTVIFTPSSGNNTSANLASAASFVGAVETCYSAPAISILAVADQPISIKVDQYIDAGGTQLAQSNTFTAAANAGFSRVVAANGNYCKVTLTNTGGSTTTVLQLDTQFGPLSTQDNVGNLIVSPAGVANRMLPDGASLPVICAAPSILSYPSSQSFTATGTSQYSVESGGTYVLSLTNAPGATTGYVGTTAFQWSANGTTWNSASVTPISSLPGAGKVNVGSSTAPGLWVWNAPTDAAFFRFNVTAYTSGTIWSYLEPYAIGMSIAMPWTPTVTSGQTIMPFVDASMFAEIGVQVSAVTTTVAIPQGTNDPTGTTVNSIGFKDATSPTSAGSTTISAATPNAVFQPAGHKWIRLQCITTGTVFTIQGITGVIGTQTNVTAGYTTTVFSSTSNAGVNISQVGGTATVNGGLAGTLAVGGSAAHSAATTTNPVTTGGRVVPTTVATVDATLVAGDSSFVPISTGYQKIIKPFGTAELDWASIANFTPTVWASSATLTNIRAASGTANIRTYISGLQLQTDALGAATDLWILDGAVSISSSTVATPGVITSGVHDFKVGDAIVLQGISSLALTGVSANQIVYVATAPSTTTFTVALTPGGTGVQCTVTGTATAYRILYRARLQTSALPVTNVEFPNPLRTAPNVALSAIASSTTTGSIYFNAQGYYGF